MAAAQNYEACACLAMASRSRSRTNERDSPISSAAICALSAASITTQRTACGSASMNDRRSLLKPVSERPKVCQMGRRGPKGAADGRSPCVPQVRWQSEQVPLDDDDAIRWRYGTDRCQSSRRVSTTDPGGSLSAIRVESTDLPTPLTACMTTATSVGLDYRPNKGRVPVRERTVLSIALIKHGAG